LKKEDALQIIKMAQTLLAEEDNMVELSPPMTVCGDLHGQFYDLLQLFKVAGDPSGKRNSFTEQF
jgi:serine/threonine-protein phosphatase 2B catalytic subunit